MREHGGSLLFCRRQLGGGLLHGAELCQCWLAASAQVPARWVRSVRCQPLDSFQEACTPAPSLGTVGPSWASKCSPRTEGGQARGPPEGTL